MDSRAELARPSLFRRENLQAAKVRVMAAQGSDALATSSRYVLLTVAAQMTGYTVKAMERKIERGDWVEGKLLAARPGRKNSYRFDRVSEMGRRSLTGGVRAKGDDRIEFTFVYNGQRYRPTLPRIPSEAN